MKDTYYFSHDYNARNDPKMQKVLMKLGQAGKGLYWDLVEMLYEEGGYLMLSECEAYAFALRSDSDCITSLINDFELFRKDDEKFWSESVLRRLDKRKEKSDKAAQSAQKRWNNANASKTDANALRPGCEGNAIKERKGKEKKESNNGASAPVQSDFEKFEIIRNEYPGTTRGPKTEWEDFKKKFSKEITTEFLRKIWLGLEAKRKTHKRLAAAGQFVPEWPHFKTYLNQRRWEEETPEKPASEPIKEVSAFNSLEEHYDYWGGTPAKPTAA